MAMLTLMGLSRNMGPIEMVLSSLGSQLDAAIQTHPSYKVSVLLTVPDSIAYHHLFPFFIRWDIWKNVVAPLFEAGSDLVKVVAECSPSLRRPLNQIRYSQDFEGLLASIEKALLVRLEEGGYVPSSSYTTGYEPVDGPLVYQRDTELAVERRDVEAAQQAYVVWEAELAAGTATEPFPAAGSSPTAEDTSLVVPSPDSPGELVARLGTSELVYAQFDE